MVDMRALRIADSGTVALGLQDEIRRSEESRYDHRLHGVLLVAQGMSCPEVAGLLGDAPRSVENWVRHFETEGLAGLQEGERPGRPRRLNSRQLAEVDAVLRKTPREVGISGNLWDGKSLAAWIKRQYGARLDVRQCQRLFRQLGFRLRKPRPMCAGGLGTTKGAKKKPPSADGRSDYGSWAIDEVHFQQHGSRCRMWIAPETKDPVLLHHPTRRSGLLWRGSASRRQVLLPSRNRQVQRRHLFVFLKDLYPASTTGPRRVVVITDNARYHHARLHRDWREEHTDKLVLDYLPPYSPDLNPIERVWKLQGSEIFKHRAQGGHIRLTLAKRDHLPAGQFVHGRQLGGLE
jgi:transposase